MLISFLFEVYVLGFKLITEYTESNADALERRHIIRVEHVESESYTVNFLYKHDCLSLTIAGSNVQY